MASAPATTRHVLLTGPPGVGKTTLIHKACEALKKYGLPIQGFYTEELRDGGRRTGFDVVTLDGNRGSLARVSTDNFQSGGNEYRVGQYRVELHAFESTALPVLLQKQSSRNPLYVIDEIGKMELFSQSFKTAVKGLLNNKNTVVLTTIPMAKGKPIPFVEEIRNREDAQLFDISRENRDSILDDIVEAVKRSYEGLTPCT